MDRIGWDGVESDGMGWGGMESDGMGWDRIGCDLMGGVGSWAPPPPVSSRRHRTYAGGVPFGTRCRANFCFLLKDVAAAGPAW